MALLCINNLQNSDEVIESKTETFFRCFLLRWDPKATPVDVVNDVYHHFVKINSVDFAIFDEDRGVLWQYFVAVFLFIKYIGEHYCNHLFVVQTWISKLFLQLICLAKAWLDNFVEFFANFAAHFVKKFCKLFTKFLNTYLLKLALWKRRIYELIQNRKLMLGNRLCGNHQI